METRLARRLAELPFDVEHRPAPALDELLRGLSGRAVPASRLTRTWTLGALPARIALAYGWAWLRTLLAGDEARVLARHEARLRAAVELVGGMGYLRGVVQKVGQTIAAYPVLAPRDVVEVLESLHFEAPPMHYSLLREYVRRELGADPEELYAEFDTRAFAAASLGQVHRARLRSGEAVAVKIQYPNIARTIRTDLRNLRVLLQPLRLTRNWDAVLAQVEDVERTLLLETDYLAEARNAALVRELLAGWDDVVVPRVHPELSTGRVLTMDFVEGVHPHRFVAARPSQAERDRRGEQVLRATYRLWCHRVVAADPNPGNFLFREDGRLGLVDFGCLRVLDDDEWQAMLLGVRAAAGGEADLLAMLEKTMGLSPEDLEDEALVAALRGSCDWLWEPLRHAGPFDFTSDDYLRRGIEAFGHALAQRRVLRHMPVFVWMNRMLFGVRGLLHTLGARVDYRRVNDEELARVGLG